MGHPVECLSKVEEDGIRLSTLIKICSQVIDGQDELCLTGSSLVEAVVGVDQDVVTVEVHCHCCADYVFKKLPADRCRRHISKCLDFTTADGLREE